MSDDEPETRRDLATSSPLSGDGILARSDIQTRLPAQDLDRAVALPIHSAVPIILGANVGTTVTTTLVALTFIRNRTEFRRALSSSSIHDFYNWLSLLRRCIA